MTLKRPTAVAQAAFGATAAVVALALAPMRATAAPAKVTITLTELGLKARVPAGSTAEKALIGPGVRIQGPDLAMSIQPATQDRPATSKDAKEKSATYSPTNVKEDKLPGGWALTFESKGPLGVNYWLQARRSIGGKSYWCETKASKPEQQASALAVCKSLK